jgi:hypothetical protein
MQAKPICVLCGSSEASGSWLGHVRYLDQKYRYLECAACGSLFCWPMPDGKTVARMYGPNYAQDVGGSDSVQPKNPEAVTNYLRTRPAGVFVDYGCADGKLLVTARDMGWRTMGVELSPDVARMTEQRTGTRFAHPMPPNSQVWRTCSTWAM